MKNAHDPLENEYRSYIENTKCEDTPEARNAFFCGIAGGLSVARTLYTTDKRAFLDIIGKTIIIAGVGSGGVSKQELLMLMLAHEQAMTKYDGQHAAEEEETPQ